MRSNTVVTSGKRRTDTGRTTVRICATAGRIKRNTSWGRRRIDSGTTAEVLGVFDGLVGDKKSEDSQNSDNDLRNALDVSLLPAQIIKVVVCVGHIVIIFPDKFPPNQTQQDYTNDCNKN